MKKNDWILITCTLLYSYLFYKQSAGINFLLFNAVLVGALVIRDKELLRDKAWLSGAASALFSSFFIFMYSSDLAIVANIFSLAILSGISVHRNSSFIISIVLSIIASASAVVFMFIDWAKRKSQKILDPNHRPFYVKLLLILIPLIIALIFFAMYRSANPLFDDFTKDINFDWISFGWIFFTLLGFVLLYGFFYNRRIPEINAADENAPLNLTPEYITAKGFLNNIMRTDTENISGLILFSLLNGLLIIVNLLDLRYLWFDGTLPEGIKHKEFVHNGVGMLITSIILAILIILFYFRGAINFYKKNKWIKWMAFAWIIQNAFMIFSTAYRNNMYIQESGLSYKKIGVYVYLLLTLVGLAITYTKIMKQKSNWYMFRTHTAVSFFILVLSCAFNWDMIITRYNIAKYKEEGKKLEKYFLLDLSFKNIPILLALPDSEASKNDWEARDYYYELRGTYFNDFKTDLHYKLYKFMEEMGKMEWQSYCTEKKRVKHELSEINPGLKELSLRNKGITSLWPLREMVNLEKLDISGCQLKNAAELYHFRKLKTLNVTRNYFEDKTPLYHLKNLDTLTIEYTNNEEFSKLQQNLPKTKIVMGDSSDR